MSYSHFVPSFVLAYAASSKLWSSFTTVDVTLLTPGELLVNVFHPLAELTIAVLLIARASFALVATAFCLFSCYAAFLFHLLWNGESNCGCIGAVFSNTRLMLAVDFTCLGLLAHSSFVSSRYRSQAFIALVLGAVPLFTALWWLSPIKATQVKAVMNPGPLGGRIQYADLTPASPNYETTIEICNRTRKTLDVSEIFVSCGCTDFQPQSFSLAAGAKIELRLTIDLNKAYTDVEQQSASHVVAATFYDSNMLPIDELIVFTGKSSRNFTAIPDKLSKFWGESNENSVLLAIRYFDEPRQPVNIFLNDQFVQSTTDESVRVALDTPRSIYEEQTVRLATAGASGSSVAFDISVLAAPRAITWETRADGSAADGLESKPPNTEISAQLLTNAGSHTADVKVWDAGDTLMIDNTELSHVIASYLSLEHDAGDGILQRLVYPIFSAKGE